MISPKYDPRAADSWKYDYAIIRLKEAVGAKEFPLLHKKRLCYWGSYDCGDNTFLEVLDKARLEGKTACTAGYSHDRGAGKTMWFAAGKLTGVDLTGRTEVMNIAADACHGQSGSPVWIKTDGKRYLVGILKKIATGTSNSALRINQEVFDQISKWFEAARETPELEAAQSLEEVEVEEELEAEELREGLEDGYEGAEDEEVEWKADSEEQIEDAEGTDYEEKADEENFGFQDEDESRQSRYKRLSNQYDEEELEAAFLDELSESMVFDLKEPSAIESEEELDERLKAAPGSAPKCYQIVSSTTGNLPAIGFEFDMNYGASTVRPPLEQPDNATVYSLEGKHITTHRIKQEGFRLEGDGNRIEIGTKHFELSDSGRTEMKKVMKDTLALVTDLKRQCDKAEPDLSLGYPTEVGAPRYFTPSYLESGVACLFPLGFSQKKRYYAKWCALGASPQATFTLPLARIDELVTIIKESSEGKKVAGRSLSGPTGYRQGLRSRALYGAQKAVNASRKDHIKAKTQLSNGDAVTSANFTPTLQGLLILMISYLRASELPYDRTPNGSWDYEDFAKAYLPLNVKNPFRLFYADLTAEEKRVFNHLYDTPRENLWKLAKDRATAADGGNQLFPRFVKGHQECWFDPVPTWDGFVALTVTNTPLLRNNMCVGTEKKGEDVGCEVLFAPLSRIIPYEPGSRRVTVEMRRLGFNWVLSHGYEKDGIQHPDWSEMTQALFQMALKLNK